MSMSEEKAPQRAVPGEASSQSAEAPDAADVARPEAVGAEGAAAGLQDALSPAVRRLVRQFDLDITGIHGTGPAGRIRVGDVMGLLNGRQDTGRRDAPARPAVPDDDAGLDSSVGETADSEPAMPMPAATVMQVPTSTVFDCDVSRVLSHRKKLRLGEVELLTTSYFLTALTAALDATPEITAGHAPRFGVALSTTGGEQRSAFLDTAALSWDSALDERVRAVDAALRANLDADDSTANLLVHHYGESGSLLATPTPIGAGHAASIGIGRVRREIVVRTVDGVETPRVAARCYLSLSFFPDNVPLHHANRALADAVRILESWPEDSAI
jgi:pyruvate/2-oxoglutarate dehydrogenase complex dihydrolipoamide acyltransferase (E2) component